MRRPITRSRAKALEQSRCNLCCREIIAMKPLTESNGKKPKSRLRNVACTSLIPREVFDAGIMKRWHTDDSDSEDVELLAPPKKKRKAKKSKKQTELDENVEQIVSDSEMQVIPELPDEMWLKIFRLLLVSGHYPSMHRLQLVCRRWNRLSRHPSLWRDVDLSCAGTRWIPYRDSTLEWLSKHRLHSLQKINLHGWHCLTSEGLEHVAKHCPKLKAVELAFCSHINRDAIYTLTKYCKGLSRVNLANTTSDIVCVYPMVHLAKATGVKLKSLDLSGNLLRGFNTVLNAICENCPNLEELDVGRCRGDLLNMDIELWQHSLPSLRVFSLSYSIFQTVQVLQPTRSSPGWPKLEVLSLAMSSSGGTKIPPPIDDALLKRFLCNSDSLRQLDVRGCHEVSASLLLKLPLPNIKILELGVFSDANQDGLRKLLHKHGSQLEEVNLSWTTYSQSIICSAVQALIRTPNSCLRLLFLARTLITVEDMMDIITLRPGLTRIELKDCANLPHEWRKLFNSDSKIKRLHKLVRSYMEKKNREGEVNTEVDESKKKEEKTE